ncbi:hypothetical protein [Anaerosporobacter sp.]|uniref:hypothetical protein n=1 Tax=Anaerosporobacter sp. TaxID=1872529 RepID=UPI00286EE8C4|nr:hypothetical protein [Anaerosporobacter sp.]
MLVVKGIIQGNTIVVEDEDIKAFDGKDVIITILDYPYQQIKRKDINFDKFVKPTERGQNVDSYIKELRENVRL